MSRHWSPKPGATLRCNPAAMQGRQGAAKQPRCLMILDQLEDGTWLAMPTTTSWADTTWQRPIDNGRPSDWGIEGGWDFRSRRPQYWAIDQWAILTDADISALASEYGRLNYAPDWILEHGRYEYDYALEHGLLEGDAYRRRSRRLPR